MSAAAIFPPTVIRASAGTGKTYQLSNRFIALLVAGAEPDEILATTFTRKAAGEIFDRVLLRLAQSATDDAKRRDLGDKIGKPKITQAECQALLLKTVRNMHRLRIGTLDSHFAKIAGTFALELGLPLGWSICDEQVDKRLRDEAIEAVLDREQTQDILTLMHLLTKGEVNRGVSDLVMTTVRDLYNLYREAPPEAWEQVPRTKPLNSEQLAAAVEAVRSFVCPANKIIEKARAADLECLATEAWDIFISKGIASKVLAEEETFSKWKIPPELRSVYQTLLKHAKAVLVQQLAMQTEATKKLLEKFAAEYHVLQHDRRALRFDDITHRLARVIDVATPEKMAFRLDMGISHLLLDEFQDTSLAQWQVLRPVAQLLAAGKRKKNANGLSPSFFCVGDVKQAIYGWRGGIAEIFGALDQELPDLKCEPLNCSYRSSPPVIDAVNQVFTHLTDHPNLEHHAEFIAPWQSDFPHHSTARSELSGYVELRTCPQAGDDENQTAVLQQYAAEQIAELAAKAPGCSIGVLVRKNDCLARLIYLLRKLNIAASEEGGNPLTDSAAVQVILSLLRLADHPGHTAARFHVANSPLAEYCGLKQHGDAAAAVRLSQEIRRQLLDEGYGATIHRLAKQLAPACCVRDQNRLQQLLQLAFQYQRQSTLRCDDFISLVESTRVSDPSSANVRVMTIHQSKGLQFDIVVLPELQVSLSGQSDDFVVGRPGPTQAADLVCRYANESVQKLLPARFQKLFAEASRQDVQESLCMLYVAMTRAVHALHMIIAPAKSNERNLPKTWAGLLRAALAIEEPATANKRLWRTGDEKWLDHRPADAACPVREVDDVLPMKIAFAPPLVGSSRNVEQTSPSSLEGGNLLQVARLLDPPDRERTRRGTLYHAWLEQIEWLDEGTPVRNLLLKTAADVASETGVVEELDEYICAFDAVLSQPQIAALLQRSSYKTKPSSTLEVCRERKFAVLDGDELLRGAIDRLVLTRSGDRVVAADIIDFKTDTLPPGDKSALADRVEFYRPQLAAYRRAVAKMWALEERAITTRLVFLATGSVVSV